MDDDEDADEDDGDGEGSSRTRIQVDGWLTLETTTAAIAPLLCLRHRLSACFAAKVRASFWAALGCIAIAMLSAAASDSAYWLQQLAAIITCMKSRISQAASAGALLIAGFCWQGSEDATEDVQDDCVHVMCCRCPIRRGLWTPRRQVRCTQRRPCFLWRLGAPAAGPLWQQRLPRASEAPAVHPTTAAADSMAGEHLQRRSALWDSHSVPGKPICSNAVKATHTKNGDKGLCSVHLHIACASGRQARCYETLICAQGQNRSSAHARPAGQALERGWGPGGIPGQRPGSPTVRQA